MKFISIVLKVVLLAFLVVGLNADSADAPTVTVKGYVLDSACAFTKGLDKPISKQVCDFLRECRLAAGHPCR